MQKPNDLNQSRIILKQDSTLIAVIEMSLFLVRARKGFSRMRLPRAKIHHDSSAVRCGTAPGAARWGASPHAYPMNEGSAQVLACSLNHAVSKAGGAKAKNRNHFAKLGGGRPNIPSAALARKPADGWPLHEGGTQTRSRQLRQKVRELGKCANSRRGRVFLFSSRLSLLYPRIRRVRG